MSTKYKFPDDFFFGVSNAAGQVEDQLNDTWIQFADAGKIPCFKDISRPKEKLRFWTEPEVELDLAKELGVQVFRLSFDWHRLCPREGEWDEGAAARYLEILKSIKSRGMKVMATLFHHGVPDWFAAKQGWSNKTSKGDFVFYSQKAFEAFDNEVDYWITLNEPVPWSYLTYADGLFPPGIKGSFFKHQRALKNMALSHNVFYQYAHKKNPEVKVGIAHHMGHHKGRGFFNSKLSKLSDKLAHWNFLEKIRGRMDFFGINYYGAEWMTLKGPAQYPEYEYSDAGRAVDPEGLYILLKRIAKSFPGVPILVTENGIGDGTDWIKPAYLCEHLVAIHKAMGEGVPVKGYVHWTLSDNLEWTDGYGPKFGLVAVDRKNNLKRYPRPSFYLYRNIIKGRGITAEQRESAWKNYRSKLGLGRPYWRGEDNKSGRDTPLSRSIPDHNWFLP